MLADYVWCDCIYVQVVQCVVGNQFAITLARVLADYMCCDCMYVPVVKCGVGNQFAITLGKGVS